MRVVIDRSKCIGSGNCVVAAPAVFTQDDDEGTVVVLDENPPETLRNAVETAAAACPMQVISLV